MASAIEQQQDDDDTCSEASSAVHNGSVISTVPDRHGFLGGSQYTPDPKLTVPPSVILRRERKWLRMLNNWEKMMNKHYRKVRERCRKGIPPSVRPRAWLYLCGGKLVQDQCREQYAALIKQEGDPKWVDDIRKDLHRQFPYHEMFVDQNGLGQQELFQVLKAYSIMNKTVGYCQAQAPIAAFLLMHMPAEQAFWCLVSICDKYLVGYYSQGMETLQLDGDILFGLLKKVSPSVYKHIKKQKIEPILYMTEWFLCVFTRTLPWDTILRVWDMFLCEGVKVIFKTALVLLKFSLGRPGVIKSCPTMYETLEVLRNPPIEVVEEEFMISQILRLNLSEEDFDYEHRRQLARRRASQENGHKSKR
ncbi:TBC1 domain family member whacked [Schistocerca americana]|uniref:TBC1 domain family member whacked n=1 Tax=Schistocerca americana TaxID=7009 RepID=UPI001F4F9735|nr:TBC1 domain family member whacked [Schistocerca americana]XP_046980116.1 TBC1 domain family member whacked [Schistocerca americana]XP_049941928.1 TBC1 domain family member whacked [Schistocerca serialis cubense]XP_049941929.1 TBC1 domain family member whacked [Schistocerca serialis cubense]